MEDVTKDIVGQTSGFMPRDIQALVSDVAANLVPKEDFQVEKPVTTEADASSVKAVEDNTSTVVPKGHGKEGLMRALERSKNRNASALGAPKVTK